MATITTTANEEPAEVLIPGGLILVLSTTRPTPGKDHRNALVHPNGERVQY